MLRNNSVRPGFSAFVCGFSTLALLAGCSGGGSNSNPTPPSISVSVSPTTSSLSQSGTKSFAATVQNDSKSAGVTWSIGNGISNPEWLQHHWRYLHRPSHNQRYRYRDSDGRQRK